MQAKVCLISPPSRAFNHYRPPLGLMYIASYLEKEQIDAEIIDTIIKDQIFARELLERKEEKMEEIATRVANAGAKYVGISCCTPEFDEVMDLARKIKRKSPEIVVVVGGVHATLYPQDFCEEESPVDYVVIGEGEVTMADLIKTIDENKPIRAVKGIVFFNKNKKMVERTPPRPLIKDLDYIPFPAFEKVDMQYYTQPNPYSIRGIFLSSFYILTSRGCPSRCTFCVAKKLRETHRGERYVRFRSPENIFEEIKLLREKYNVDSFYVIDDFFVINQKSTRELCRLLLENKINLLWGCQTKVPALKEETVEIMRRSGCVQIDFGVESGSQRMLDLIKKDIFVETTKRVFALCEKYGIRTFANILINLPSETEGDLRMTINLLDEIHPSVTSFNIFTPYLGTQIYDDYDLNLKKSDYYLLGKPPLELIRTRPKLFRFAVHKLDFDRFVRENHPKYNPTLKYLKAHVSIPYVKLVLRSKQKFYYIKQFGNLIREYRKQKGLLSI